MKTNIYLVRHSDAPKSGIDRKRPLSEKGQKDTLKITELLKDEGIDVFVSSPYKRAILTIEHLANLSGQTVEVIEDLKERVFSNAETRMTDQDLLPLITQSYSEPTYSLPGAESNLDCQTRAIRVLNDLLDRYQGRNVAIGTHGAIMTLMMGYFDNQYAMDFLWSLSKPDVYKLEFLDQKLTAVSRLWRDSIN